MLNTVLIVLGFLAVLSLQIWSMLLTRSARRKVMLALTHGEDMFEEVKLVMDEGIQILRATREMAQIAKNHREDANLLKETIPIRTAEEVVTKLKKDNDSIH